MFSFWDVSNKITIYNFNSFAMPVWHGSLEKNMIQLDPILGSKMHSAEMPLPTSNSKIFACLYGEGVEKKTLIGPCRTLPSPNW